MIQRVQSIYLLLVTAISALLFIVPVFNMETMPTGTEVQASTSSFLIPANSFLLILNCAIGAIAFIAIFMFKKRKVQLRACNLNMILICVLVGLLFYTADTLMGSSSQRVHYKFGSYLPLIQLVFTFLATRAVKKDEELVRSSERLR